MEHVPREVIGQGTTAGSLTAPTAAGGSVAEGGRGPDAPGDEHHDGKKRDHWTLLQKVLALLTALLTLATAAVGLWGAQARSERDDLQDKSNSLETELEATVEERDQLVGELERAQGRIDELEATPTTITTSTTRPLGGTVASGATPLADLDRIEGDWYVDRELAIDGTTYLQGIRSSGINACNNNYNAVQQVEYSIDRSYTTLNAVVGLSDESASGFPVQIEITGDGQPLWTQTVQVGQPQAIALDVTGILRLKFVATKQFDESTGCPEVYAALGDPALD
jgi:hypothetical protein